jgi:hypothetical protein
MHPLVNRLSLGLSEQIDAGLREPDERSTLVHHQPGALDRHGLRQFRLDKIEVCCGLQKLVRPMMLQGCCKADRAEVVERDRFATPNSLKSHGRENQLAILVP